MAPALRSRSVLVLDRFAPEARPMRAVFDERFREPRALHPDRFRWDPWHVPDQYTLLRTPGWEYFPAPLYRKFHERLVHWGRRVLGCHDVSPPWLSCYVNGCEQALHGDLPHGPFAWVFSLTRWEQRTFTGGETLLLQDRVLDYWESFRSVESVESAALTTRVEPKFGRLVVFDPRIPHGVRRVAGSMDPREGRLVLHGWFVMPRPFVEGPLPARRAAEVVEAVTDAVGPWVSAGLPVAGVATFRFGVGPEGQVKAPRLLVDTTRVPQGDEPARAAMLREVLRTIRAQRFPRAKGASTMTLPLVFERG